jgi:hypothetical protein
LIGSKRYARRQDGRELQGRRLLACCLEEMGLGRERERQGTEGDCRQGKEGWTQQQRNSGRARLAKGSTPANQLQGVIRRADVDEASEQCRIPLSLMLAKASEVRERAGAVSEDHMEWVGMGGDIAWR